MLDEQNRKAGHPEPALESWKAIAAYLQRDAKTARKWEKEEGLPIHRHSHKSRSSVYAFASEIDAWKASRRVTPEPAAPKPWWRSLGVAATALLCLVMVGNSVRPQVVSAQQAPAPRQLWTATGDVTYSTISPDGRFVAFRGKYRNLVLHDVRAGSDLQLTHNEDPHEWAGRAVFSPDGKQIVFNWYRDSVGELRVMNLSGGSVKRLFRSEDAPALGAEDWSLDGKWIAVQLFRSDKTAQIASDLRGGRILPNSEVDFLGGIDAHLLLPG